MAVCAAGDLVPNKVLRERFEEMRGKGMTVTDLAKELGWRSSNKWDTTRVNRVLGLATWKKTGGQRRQVFVTYEMAVCLCRALDMDPYEAGV